MHTLIFVWGFLFALVCVYASFELSQRGGQCTRYKDFWVILKRPYYIINGTIIALAGAAAIGLSVAAALGALK